MSAELCVEYLDDKAGKARADALNATILGENDCCDQKQKLAVRTCWDFLQTQLVNANC